MSKHDRTRKVRTEAVHALHVRPRLSDSLAELTEALVGARMLAQCLDELAYGDPADAARVPRAISATLTLLATRLAELTERVNESAAAACGDDLAAAA